MRFQSTLPVGGGTRRQVGTVAMGDNFNPPSPWGEGQGKVFITISQSDISIHPPRGGRDIYRNPQHQRHQDFNPPSPWGEGRGFLMDFQAFTKFQSTLPVGGGTAMLPRAKLL